MDNKNKKILLELDNEAQLNILHGILVEEENKINELSKILFGNNTNKFKNTKKAFEEVRKIRRKLTEMDTTSDEFGVVDRIKEYRLEEV